MENEYSKLAMGAANGFKAKHPELETEVNDLFMLMQDEINDGNSPSSEYYKFIESLNELEDEQTIS